MIMFKQIVLSCACAVMMVACTSESDQVVPQNPENELVDVFFNLGGDYASVEESPFTRAFAPNAKTICAIQIYTGPDKMGPFSPWNDFVGATPIAYGLFDDMEKLGITLPPRDYWFRVLLLEEREDTIPHKEGIYSYPFITGLSADRWDNGGPAITNSFIKSNERHLDDMVFGSTSRIDKYYTNSKIDVTKGGTIDLPLDRHAFSITYNIVPPFDGKIKVLRKKGDKQYLMYECSAYDNPKNECVIYGSPYCGLDSYSIDYKLDLVITWERGSQDKKSYTVEKTITIKNKYNYTLNIDMNARDCENPIEINKDDDQFTENTITID